MLKCKACVCFCPVPKSNDLSFFSNELCLLLCQWLSFILKLYSAWKAYTWVLFIHANNRLLYQFSSSFNFISANNNIHFSMTTTKSSWMTGVHRSLFPSYNVVEALVSHGKNFFLMKKLKRKRLRLNHWINMVKSSLWT